MKILRKDLLGVLGKVTPLVKGRTTLPILSMVKLEALNGGFHASATDLHSYIKASCCCDGQLEACCVAPGPLLALCAYGPDEITLELEETHLKVVSAATGRVSFLKADQFPAWPEEKMVELGVNPSDLAEAIEAVAFAADPKSTQGIMRQSVCVSLATKNNAMIAYACDGRVLGRYSKPAVVPDAEFVVVADSTKPLCEVLRGTNPKVQLSAAWIGVLSLDFCCAIRLVDGAYLNIKPIISEKNTAVGEIPRDATVEALAAMKSLGNGDGYVYGVATALKNGLELEYAGKTNDFRAVVECSMSDKPKTQVHFDAVRLHDLLNNMPDDKVKFSTSDNQMRFESGNILAILAVVTPPVR